MTHKRYYGVMTIELHNHSIITVRIGSENRYDNDMCSKELWTTCSKFVILSKFNCQHNGKTYVAI